jgi:hypothetical protein
MKNLYLILLLLSLCGCKKNNSVSAPTNSVSLPNRPALGSFNYGGVVFYILKSGDVGYDPKVWHGLVFANTRIDNKYWGCYDVLIPNANSTLLGDGKLNTFNISKSCPGLPENTASYCQNLIVNRYDDWYLPTKDELQKIHDDRIGLQSMPNISFPTNHPYASSSQIDSKTFYAIRFAKSDLQWFSQLKSAPYYASAIPIRSF